MARLSVDERRRVLVDAAIQVMTRDGVAKATTRAVVTEAGMQLGFFHYCFESKEDLLAVVVETITERNVAAAMASVAPRRAVADMLREGMHAYWRGVEGDPATHQLTYELTQYALRRPGLDAVARRQYAAYLQATTRFLDAVAAAADVTWAVPVPVLARHAAVVLDGATLAWIVDRDTAGTLAVLDQAAAAIAAHADPACTAGRGNERPVCGDTPGDSPASIPEPS
ncbi:TetR/AcrR family transcriptional regulator [Pseudonocardia sp. CA-107938]|uniref:TetR/AcrR family transcriptional regulator n=1 Tax=Pseudonocardia sp. CA-107938 TaxID=3240021 RepID=UPI003D91ADCA